MSQPEEPKIQIDSDWKAEAQAEKERLAKKEQETEAKRGDGPGPGQLPEASFGELMRTLATHAVMGLGAMGDPKSGRVVIDLPGSRFAIDLLGVLEEKTKGNLTDEERDELHQTLVELRAQFVRISQMVAQQNVGAGAEAVAAIDPAAPGVSGVGPTVSG